MICHGVLLLDKPEKMTSHQLVQKVRKIFGQKKVGHCGTLDPLATGLMVLTLGRACKLNQRLTNGNKTYDLEVQLGVVTDTLDREGRIVEKNPVHLENSFIEEQARQCLGELDLSVPAFSAKKVQGRKLYEYARAGEDVPVVKKSMYFYDLHIHSITKDRLLCRLSCSKGSYIRAWAHELGKKLGVGACLYQLRRLESEPYHLDQGISFQDLESMRFPQLENHPSWIPIEKCGL